MCGIAGMVGQGNCYLEDLEKMIQAIANRGPNGKGTWIENDGTFALGHRRLSIIDLSDNGLQPMISSSGRMVMSFNGEIYNYKSIQAMMIQKYGDIKFKSSTDSEVLLESFELLGIKETLKRIQGMFAIAIYDREERKLFCIRDRIGEKPLYYGNIDGKFYFASDLAAIHAVAGEKLVVNKEVLNLFLKHNFIPAPYTIYQNIYKQIPGTIITVGIQGDPTVEEYYNLADVAKQNKSNRSFDESADLFETILKDVTSEQLYADVPVGVFLSGGVDSSLVAAISQEVCEKKINTYSIGFENSEYDEAKFATEVANSLGTNHHVLYLKNEDIFNEIVNISEVFSEPYANYSAIPSVLVSKYARQEVTVALGGDGGDEFWAGYEQYSDTYNEWNRLKKLTPFQKDFLKKFESCKLFSLDNRINRHFRINKDLPYLDCSTALQVYKKYTKLDDYSSKILISNYRLPYACTRDEELFENVMEDSMLMDQMCCLVDDSCVKIDRAGMSVGLEVRSPLLDARIIDFCWSLPCEYKYRKGMTKAIPRDVLYRYVPKGLIERPKQPFWFPAHEWLREGYLREWAEELLNEKVILEEEIFDYNELLRMWRDYINNRRWHPEIWSFLMFETWSKRWMK